MRGTSSDGGEQRNHSRRRPAARDRRTVEVLDLEAASAWRCCWPPNRPPSFIASCRRPPGINDWWEPVSINRKGHSVASMRLTRAAVRYRAHAEEVLSRAGVDLVALEDEFRDLWLQMHVVSYVATPMERDSDGPLKPLQDLLCDLLGVNDARVRYSAGSLLLDARAAARGSAHRGLSGLGCHGLRRAVLYAAYARYTCRAAAASRC